MAMMISLLLAALPQIRRTVVWWTVPRCGIVWRVSVWWWCNIWTGQWKWPPCSNQRWCNQWWSNKRKGSFLYRCFILRTESKNNFEHVLGCFAVNAIAYLSINYLFLLFGWGRAASACFWLKKLERKKMRWKHFQQRKSPRRRLTFSGSGNAFDFTR